MLKKSICRRIICSVFAVLILAAFLLMPSVNVHGHVVEFGAGTGDYEEYLQFMEEWDVDPRFVRYETFQMLGTFNHFTSSDGIDGYQTPFGYHYEVVDKNGYTFIFNFRKYTQTPYRWKQCTVFSTSRDMLTVNTTKSIEIVRGPLRYRYHDGKLSHIRWVLGDVDVELRQDPRIHMPDYPMDGENTIYRRLLSRNYFVALAAYYELIGGMPLQPGETWFSRIQYIIWPVVALILLIAACIAAVWIFLRIRRKKKAMSPTQWHNDRCNRKRIRKDNSSLQKEATRTDHD